MPESNVRKAAADKKKVKREVDAAERRSERQRRVKAPSSRRWVAPTFVTTGLLGVVWLITYYVAGTKIPYMRDWANWNILVGMGLMAAAFTLATLWK